MKSGEVTKNERLRGIPILGRGKRVEVLEKERDAVYVELQIRKRARDNMKQCAMW